MSFMPYTANRINTGCSLCNFLPNLLFKLLLWVYHVLRNAYKKWSSGSTLACGATVRRSNLHCRQFFFTKFTVPPRDGKWVTISLEMGECSTYSSLQVDSKVKFAAWTTSWRLPGPEWLSPRGTKLNSCIWLCTVVSEWVEFNTPPNTIQVVSE